MSDKLLLPNRFKFPGWCIFVPSLVLGIIITSFGYETGWLKSKVFAVFSSGLFGKYSFFHYVDIDPTNTIVGSLFILGGLLVGFSKEKREDEFIAKIRLSSLLWAVFVNYILLLLSFIFVYDTAFLNVMIYNMFTVLVIFIGRFNYLLYKATKSGSDEK